MAELRKSSNPTSPQYMRRKSSSTTTTTTTTTTTHKMTSPRPEPTMIKRRNSSFANTSSPWFRRNSFLSPTMIQNENFSVYESPSYFSDSASFSIISLRECQGFIFNQDLFATPYQQSRSLANERKFRNSFSTASNTSTTSKRDTSMTNCSSVESLSQRRHTSYHAPRPPVFSYGGNLDSSAIIDDSMEDDNDNDNESIPQAEDYDDEDNDSEMTTTEEYEEYEEYEEMNGYGGDSTNRRYRVRVTDIIINEQDRDIFPS